MIVNCQLFTIYKLFYPLWFTQNKCEGLQYHLLPTKICPFALPATMRIVSNKMKVCHVQPTKPGQAIRMGLKFVNISDMTTNWSRNIENRHKCGFNLKNQGEGYNQVSCQPFSFHPVHFRHTRTLSALVPSDWAGWLPFHGLQNDGLAIFLSALSLLLLSKSSAKQASGRRVKGWCGGDGYVHHLCWFAPGDTTGVTWASSDSCEASKATLLHNIQQILHSWWRKSMRKSEIRWHPSISWAIAPFQTVTFPPSWDVCFPVPGPLWDDASSRKSPTQRYNGGFPPSADLSKFAKDHFAPALWEIIFGTFTPVISYQRPVLLIQRTISVTSKNYGKQKTLQTAAHGLYPFEDCQFTGSEFFFVAKLWPFWPIPTCADLVQVLFLDSQLFSHLLELSLKDIPKLGHGTMM